MIIPDQSFPWEPSHSPGYPQVILKSNSGAVTRTVYSQLLRETTSDGMLYKPPLLFREEREVKIEDGIPKVRWLLSKRQVFQDEDGAYYIRLTTYERVKPLLQSAAILFGLWYFMTQLITMSEEGRIEALSEVSVPKLVTDGQRDVSGVADQCGRFIWHLPRRFDTCFTMTM